MLTNASSFTALSDADLIAQVKRLAAGERQATVQLIAALVELDTRRLYLAHGCSSLFTYCVQVLHLSEHAAHGRIEAARAARRFPVILDYLADGRLTLTAVGLLATHLTPDNHRRVLDAARHKTKREVELLVAQLRPQTPVAPTIRKLPTPARAPTPSPLLNVPAAPTADRSSTGCPPDASPPGSNVSVPSSRPSVVAPLAPEIYKLQVTLGRETVEKLRRAQELLRHAIPTGDIATILDRALRLLIAEIEGTKLASTAAPRSSRAPKPGSRHIPARVRRAVWARDEGHCTFIGATGRRCSERGFLEFHHLEPYARGGRATVERSRFDVGPTICTQPNSTSARVCLDETRQRSWIVNGEGRWFTAGRFWRRSSLAVPGRAPIQVSPSRATTWWARNARQSSGFTPRLSLALRQAQGDPEQRRRVGVP